MRVTVSVGGRFHAFNLAHELERHGYLYRLITSYPAGLAARFGVPRTKVRSVLIKEVLERGWRKLPESLRNLWNPQFFITEVFDRLASLRIGHPDIFVGWANQSLHSLRRAKARGAITILERGSSHILYQNKILKEEYEKFGLPLRPFMTAHPKIIEKELREYAEADYISVPSLYAKRTFLERGVPEGRLIHIPYGVDLDAFHPVPKRDEVFRVIFVGGMTLRKGIHYLLQAFTELNLPNSELLLIGSMNPETRPFFEKYEGHYRYIGHIPQAELYKYYSEGSVFCLPSIEEGLGMVQLQAMACGLPAIVSVNTGGEDIIRDGKDGFIIPIRDVETLKEKILWMYENPEGRKKMGHSALERIQKGFTWEDYGRKIVAAYEKVMHAHGFPKPSGDA